MFTLPELPYAYNALEPYIDEKTMRIHHGKHHGTYVKNLNDALSGQKDWLEKPLVEVLQNLADLPEEIRTKVRNNGGGHFNHKLFWELMLPGGSKAPVGKLLDSISACCGNFDTFKEHFKAKALGRFGSGWVWLVKEKDETVSIQDTPNQDSPVMEGKNVLLGLDVWEHAYYLKYQNMRADYIQAWWNVINWDIVNSRYAES